MKYFDDLYEQIKQTNKIEGYSIEEIEKAERAYGKKFPKAYIEFLHLMGKYVSFLSGIDYSMYELKEYRGGAECYLYSNFNDNGLQFLKEDDLVFISSQGCTHYFMSISEGENPPVKLIHEGQLKLEADKIYKSFTEFIMKKSRIEGK